MTLDVAIWLFVAAVIGLVLVCKFLRGRRTLRIVCIVLLSLIALALASYIGLTVYFVDAVRHQPLAP